MSIHNRPVETPGGVPLPPLASGSRRSPRSSSLPTILLQRTLLLVHP